MTHSLRTEMAVTDGTVVHLTLEAMFVVIWVKMMNVQKNPRVKKRTVTKVSPRVKRIRVPRKLLVKSDKTRSKEDTSKTKIGNSTSNTNNLANITNALPAPTLTEGIELSGAVTDVVDGDTLDVNGIRIRLALVNTPEVGQPGFDSAKRFVENLCLFKSGEVDMDDGQRQGSFGREIGVVYCERVNVNQALMNNSLATIDVSFCDVSEFAHEVWAVSHC